MDLAARLEQLEELIREAKSMPLSSSVLMNREEVLELIAELKEAMPEELKQARWIVKDREELLSKARDEGERIVEQAEPRRAAPDGPEGGDRRPGRRRSRPCGLGGGGTCPVKCARRQRTMSTPSSPSSRSRSARSSKRRKDPKALNRTLDQVEVGRERLRGPANAAEAEFARPSSESELFDEEEDR